MLYINPEDHLKSRVDTHPSRRQHHVNPISSNLYVACAITNPQRFYSRYKLYHAFEKHVADSGAILYTAELALGDRHHEITDHANPNHIQLRSEHELWHKENLLNICVGRFPHDWKYGCYIDADFLMTRPDWVNETLHMLQHYRWVQMFSNYSDLDPNHDSSHPMRSFASILHQDPEAIATADQSTPYQVAVQTHKLSIGAPGGAWAFRRDAFDEVGGFLDTCVLGSADWHMAFALADKANWHREIEMGTPGYVDSLRRWSDRAKLNRGSVGCVNCFAVHNYHGNKSKRSYVSRSSILRKHGYDPNRDIVRDWQGVIRWAGNKPMLEEDVRRYFLSRDEDS